LQNLGSRVFFIWGSTCVLCFIYAYFLVWETKGLTLEQVDRMMEEVANPIKSAKWKPHSTYAAELGINKEGKLPLETHEKVSPGETAHIVAGTHALHLDEADAINNVPAAAPAAGTAPHAASQV
jgi:hypothetical protein